MASDILEGVGLQASIDNLVPWSDQHFRWLCKKSCLRICEFIKASNLLFFCITSLGNHIICRMCCEKKMVRDSGLSRAWGKKQKIWESS